LFSARKDIFRRFFPFAFLRQKQKEAAKKKKYKKGSERKCGREKLLRNSIKLTNIFFEMWKNVDGGDENGRERRRADFELRKNIFDKLGMMRGAGSLLRKLSAKC
jgi:hypothetical protein